MGRTPNEPDPSTGPLALFAAEHRRYRRHAGITQAQLAAELNYTNQFVGMIEVAQRTPSRQYVDQTDRILDAGGGLVNCWLLVSRMHVPKWFGPFIDVERRCTSMREWECMVVPGLLQTEEYARALGHAGRPNATDEQIEREVEVRMHRQEILYRPAPPLLWTVIDEFAFLRYAGGPAAMSRQYEHLLEMAELPHVVIQILPTNVGVSPGEIGAFTILELEDQPEIIWAEGPGDGRFVDRADHVEDCIRRYDHLRAMALSPDASREKLRALLEAICTATDSRGASPATAPARADSASRSEPPGARPATAPAKADSASKSPPSIRPSASATPSTAKTAT